MHVVLETLMTVGLILYYLVESWVLHFIPASLRSKEVKGQTVLITGAGSGIGRLMSIRFGKLGCTLVLVDVNKTGNDETASLVRETGAVAHTYVCDLSKREDTYRMCDKVKNEIGEIDILVNNAGVVSGKKLLECTDAQIELTMDVNINAHFWTLKSFLPSMLERNSGHVVNIASIAGWMGVRGLVDYCASKYAAVGLDESLRLELAEMGKTGVRTTVVCPYYINTGMFEGSRTRFSAILPILDQEYVADKILEAVLTNQEVLFMPRILYVLMALRNMFPTKVLTVLADFFGLNVSMDEWRGRTKKD